MKLVVVFFCMISLIYSISCQIPYPESLWNISAHGLKKLSPQCLQDWQKFNILTTTYWSLVDSSSKLPSGIAKGNIMPLGNYDECLDIQEVETKFCQVSININFLSNYSRISPPLKKINTELVGVVQDSTTLSIGFYYCVFKSCSAQDMNIIFSDIVHFNEAQCWSKDSGPNLDALVIVTIVIFALLGLITIFSTIYDIYVQYNELTPFHPTTIAFSLYTNGKKLFHLGNPQQLQCLNGLKAISMLWVVLGHVYMAYVFVPLDNYLDVYNWIDATYSQYITGATVSVDTFFVVGGFLTIYTFQSAMDKGIKFNVPLYYFHRYLRLTPAMGAMVLAHAGLFNYLGSGPVWDRTNTNLVKACKENWWSALLYVQNYANPNGSCVPQSWYLSVDMQLFVISPVLLILMRQWPRWGYICLSVTSLLSMIGSFLLAWFYNLGGEMTANVNGNLSDYMTYYYMPTHTRMAPYLFGIMLGYYIYDLKTNKKKLHIHPLLVMLAWFLSLALLAVCLYAGHNLQSLNSYDHLGNSFFVALMRPVWAIAICWIVFACIMGFGGPVDTFLSLPVFQILSRLCYSIYLVHYSFIFMTNFTTRFPLHFSDYYAFHKFCGDFTFSVVIAIFWSLIFESPIIVLEKVLLVKGDRPKKNNKDSTV